MIAQGFEDRVRLALLCDYALTSQDGKVSAIGIFTNIGFAQLPSVYPRFFVMIVLMVEPGQHVSRVQIITPTGAEMLPDAPVMNLEVPESATDTNLIIGFDNLHFAQAGLHQIQLHLDGRVALMLPFSVSVVSGMETALPHAQA